MPDEGGLPGDGRTGAPSHGRGNGLTARVWVPVCDVDPRLAEPLLEVLRDADVPAYVEPSTGAVSAYLERRLPDRPTDRLFVDAFVRDQAQRIVDTTLPGLHESLEEERWAAIVAAYDEEPEQPEWPESEGAASSTTVLPVAHSAPAPSDVDDDEHFVPPDPPPPPPARPVTKYGWALLLGGLGVLILPLLVSYDIGGTLALIAVAAIIGGFVTLVVQMKDSPSDEDDPDDGAVV